MLQAKTLKAFHQLAETGGVFAAAVVDIGLVLQRGFRRRQRGDIAVERLAHAVEYIGNRRR